MYKSFFKRFIDLFFSTITLIVISPVLIITSIIIKLESEGPLFYRQKRVGKNQKVFDILKFRSMTNKPREHKELKGKTDDITRIGYVIRRFKIDELPQLINVLRGDMSLVGPRPCLIETLKDMDNSALKRFEAMPGLTGLAQVNGNIYLSWPQRWKLDTQYVQSISFINDTKIVLKTLLILFNGEEKYLNENI